MITCMRSIASCSVVFLVLTLVSRVNAQEIHRFEIVDESGVSTALTTGGPRFEGKLFDYELILTLQQDPGIIESLISSVKGFAMTEKGLFVVVDNKWAGGSFSVARLVVFGPDGKYLRYIGRDGSGPGEFQSMALQTVQGDTVEVYDDQFRRLTRYSTAGVLLDVLTPPPGFAVGFNQLHKLTYGRLVAMNVSAQHVEFWIIDSEGAVETHRRTEEVETSIPLAMGGGPVMSSFFPYHPVSSAFFLSDKRIALSRGVEPVIEVVGLDGVLNYRIRIEDLPLKITRQDIDQFNALWDERIDNTPEAARPDARKQRDALREAMPNNKPPWTYIAMDDRGYWWLRVQNDPDPWIGEDRIYTYRLLSPEGEYLGITEAPPTLIPSTWLHNTFPISVRNGHFLTMENDPETGEQLLNVYRIRPVVEGLKYPDR